jgi:hypothetical protein
MVNAGQEVPEELHEMFDGTEFPFEYSHSLKIEVRKINNNVAQVYFILICSLFISS